MIYDYERARERLYDIALVRFIFIVRNNLKVIKHDLMSTVTDKDSYTIAKLTFLNGVKILVEIPIAKSRNYMKTR